MPKASKESAPRVDISPGFEGWYIDADGYTVGIESFEEGGDFTLLFKGLPDDRCQSPHWGYVMTGEITIKYADGEETISAGEGYYIRPGHTGVVGPGTSMVEFSPTDLYNQTMEVVSSNIQQLEA